MSNITPTTSIDQWNPQSSHIERLMDNAAYTSAHPDDTLILVGPARWASIAKGTDGADAGGAIGLVPVGMLQQMQVSQQRQVQPAQAIGCSRNYFLAGKPMVNFTIGRLFAKGNNLHRALYANIMNDAKIAGFNPSEPAATTDHSAGVFNMDSELFLVPFGIAVAFRDKSGGNLGSFYIESCMISSYQVGIQSGQNIIMENINGSADRLFPINLSEGVTPNFWNPEGDDTNSITDTNVDLSKPATAEAGAVE
jgi:hypothetical protein